DGRDEVVLVAVQALEPEPDSATPRELRGRRERLACTVDPPAPLGPLEQLDAAGPAHRADHRRSADLGRGGKAGLEVGEPGVARPVVRGEVPVRAEDAADRR